MQITVVIPTHDRPELLREAIASVEAQGFDHWDVIVVDDGSRPPARIAPPGRGTSEADQAAAKRGGTGAIGSTQRGNAGGNRRRDFLSR